MFFYLAPYASNMKTLFRRLDVPLFLAWVLVFISLSLILLSGLYSDDFWGFHVRKAQNIVSFSDVVAMTGRDIVTSTESGRFTPLVYFFMELFYWLPATVLIFKIIILCVNLLAVYSFTRLLSGLGIKDWIPVALLSYCSLIQFYINYNDAFTSLHAMYPTLAVFMFWVMIAFISFLKEGRIFALIIAVILTAAVILYSEIGLVIYPVILVLIIADRRSLRHKAAIFSPFAVLMLLYICAVIFVRSHTTAFYSGVKSNWYFPAVSNVFAVQLFATFPFKSIIDADAVSGPSMTLRVLWPWMLAFSVTFLLFIKSILPTGFILLRPGFRRSLLLLGLILLFLPPSMLMLSKKYQDQLHFGLGYLPVYIQNFGLVLLMLLFIDFVMVRFPNKANLIKAISLCLLLTLSLAAMFNNYAMISRANSEVFIPSTFYIKSLRHGILDLCEDGSVIVMRNEFTGYGLYDYGNLIKDFGRKGFSLINESEFVGVENYNQRACYLIAHDKVGQFTVVYRILPGNVKTEIRRINYPKGDAFSFFELISAPL